MVNRQIVLDTIRRMKGSGIDDETIRSTLAETGISDEEIEGYLSDANEGGKNSAALAQKKPRPAPFKRFSEKSPDLTRAQESDSKERGKDFSKEREKDFSKESEEEYPKESDEDSFEESRGGLVTKQIVRPDEQNEEEPEEESLQEELGQDEELEDELPEDHEKIVQKTAQIVKEHIDDSMQTHELHHSTTQAELNEHREGMRDLNRSVEALHTKFDMTPSIPMQTISQISLIEKRINSIEKELGEIRANTEALSSLLKKIIETDREILNELQNSGK